MTYDEFVKKWDGKGCDFDGYYGFQCMDLAHQYAVEVLGNDILAVAGAKDEWDYLIPEYDKIANTPDGVPLQGDIVIWGVGVGQYGHIAIFDHGDNNSFVSFDQNWPVNSLCHLQNHNYNGVLGWFHPITPVLPVPPTQTDQTIVDLDEYGKLEVQAIRGKMGDLKQAQNELNNLNDKVIKLQSDYNGAMAQAGDLSRQLAECQNRPVIAPISPPIVINDPISSTGILAWLKRIFAN